MMSRILLSTLMILGIVAVIGCAKVAKIGTDVANQAGYIDDQQAGSIHRTVDAVERSFEDITPEQEYYIGRAVAATVLQSYTPYSDPEVNAYLNRLGQTLALASDLPETYGGYHFLLLDSDEINAFAAPGGLIMVTRGMVRLCPNEDALAAVLAHEIGHVSLKHGLKAIKSGRITSAVNILAAEGARNLGSESLRELTEQFEGSVQDVTSTLVSRGYSRDQERDADAAAVTILTRIGYNPTALVDLLDEMKKHWHAGGPGFLQTHPDPADRVGDVEPAVTGFGTVDEPVVRQERFAGAVGQI